LPFSFLSLHTILHSVEIVFGCIDFLHSFAPVTQFGWPVDTTD